MKQQRTYQAPQSEILCFTAEDVITTSGIIQNDESGSSEAWNNNGNGNGNGHWFEDGKPGNGGHKN